MRFVLLIIAMCGAVPSAAQEFRLIANGPPAAELPYEFTQVTDVLELADGRVVVLDRLLAEVRLGDLRTGSSAVLGRIGDGPREYRAPLQLVPLGGDSVGVYDDANVRILVITRSGSLGGFVTPFSTAEGTRLGGVVSDARGYLYGEMRARSSDDSASLFRWRIAAPNAEYIARIHRPLPEGAVPVGGGAVRPGSFARPGTRNMWAVSRTGALAVVGFDPYQIMLVSASGKRVKGPTISYQHVAVNDSVKRAFIADRPKVITGIVVDASGKKRAETQPVLPIDPTSITWAREVPPFLGNAFVAFDPNGRIWVQRTTFGREGARYDVFNQEGRLVDRVRLSEGLRIAAFGRTDMYLVRRDNDDLEFLQRRPMPR